MFVFAKVIPKTLLVPFFSGHGVLLHPFNGLFSRTTWVSWNQKGKPFRILMKQGMMGWQWHQLDHIQIICNSLQTDNHSVFTGWMPFLPPNQQQRSTEGKQC